MPRRNRVTPDGEIVAAPERGTVLGNRGVLHDAAGGIRRAWQHQRWIACELTFKGRRVVMTPGRYTELFFLDEATALAAGHRPCGECRRPRYDVFRTAWAAGRPAGPLPTAAELDARLHAERVAADRSPRTHPAGLDDLPDGVFVRHPAREGVACLVLGGELLVWAAGGYTVRLPRPHGIEVEVLTPATTVAVIRAGYAPGLHPSARTPAEPRG